MADVTQVHEEKETLAVDVFIPGHEERTTTPLFLHTRQQLIAREDGRCYICGRNAEEAGHALEAHHHPVERSMANMMDWERIKPLFPQFDWEAFDPANPYSFVDDMTVNGMLLCKDHHTGKGLGIHDLPYPLWIAQKYGRAGYQFTAAEIICHADQPEAKE